MSPGSAQYQLTLGTMGGSGFNVENDDTIAITPLTGNEFTVNHTFTPALGSTMPNRPNSSETLTSTANILNNFTCIVAQKISPGPF